MVLVYSKNMDFEAGPLKLEESISENDESQRLCDRCDVENSINQDTRKIRILVVVSISISSVAIALSIAAIVYTSGINSSRETTDAHRSSSIDHHQPQAAGLSDMRPSHLDIQTITTNDEKNNRSHSDSIKKGDGSQSYQLIKSPQNSDGSSGSVNRRRQGYTAGDMVAVHFEPAPVDDHHYSPFSGCTERQQTRVCKNHTALQLRQDEDVMREFWIKSRTHGSPVNVEPVVLEEGRKVRVKWSGIYYIYAQTVFLNTKYQNSLQLMKNGDVEMQCVETASSHQHEDQYQTCHISGAVYLNQYDTIAIKYPYSMTQISLHKNATYFGLVYLSK